MQNIIYIIHSYTILYNSSYYYISNKSFILFKSNPNTCCSFIIVTGIDIYPIRIKFFLASEFLDILCSVYSTLLAFKNSFAFEKEPKEHSSKEYLDLLRLQLDLQDQYAEALPRSITGLHRFFKIYVKGFRGAGELRNQLMNTKSTDEVRALLDNFGKES